MRPKPVSQLKSPLLRAHGDTVARHCYERCYRTWPELEARYGERGRSFVAEDGLWHLEHLDAAVAVQIPQLFEDYAAWLVGLLVARGVGREQVAGAFKFLAEGLERVECPEELQEHRRELVALLLDTAARILQAATPGT